MPADQTPDRIVIRGKDRGDGGKVESNKQKGNKGDSGQPTEKPGQISDSGTVDAHGNGDDKHEAELPISKTTVQPENGSNSSFVDEIGDMVPERIGKREVRDDTAPAEQQHTHKRPANLNQEVASGDKPFGSRPGTNRDAADNQGASPQMLNGNRQHAGETGADSFKNKEGKRPAGMAGNALPGKHDTQANDKMGTASPENNGNRRPPVVPPINNGNRRPIASQVGNRQPPVAPHGNNGNRRPTVLPENNGHRRPTAVPTVSNGNRVPASVPPTNNGNKQPHPVPPGQTGNIGPTHIPPLNDDKRPPNAASPENDMSTIKPEGNRTKRPFAWPFRNKTKQPGAVLPGYNGNIPPTVKPPVHNGNKPLRPLTNNGAVLPENNGNKRPVGRPLINSGNKRPSKTNGSAASDNNVPKNQSSERPKIVAADHAKKLGGVGGKAALTSRAVETYISVSLWAARGCIKIDNSEDCQAEDAETGLHAIFQWSPKLLGYGKG